jgi:hypothetical protein
MMETYFARGAVVLPQLVLLVLYTDYLGVQVMKQVHRLFVVVQRKDSYHPE